MDFSSITSDLTVTAKYVELLRTDSDGDGLDDAIDPDRDGDGFDNDDDFYTVEFSDDTHDLYPERDHSPGQSAADNPYISGHDSDLDHIDDASDVDDDNDGVEDVRDSEPNNNKVSGLYSTKILTKS